MFSTFSVVKHTKIWLGFSGLLILASFVSIGIWGLRPGIDFTGGSLLHIETETALTVAEVRETLGAAGFETKVQAGEGTALFIRTGALTEEEHTKIVTTIDAAYGDVEELRFDSVGPTVGKELQRKSWRAIIILSVLIVLYVAYAFRRVTEPVSNWTYGALTVLTGLHDVIIPLGVFAILGQVLDYQIDTTIIAALLTIMGYSINDTIVVFDRTRENLAEQRGMKFTDIVDLSVRQSFTRSFNTSFTTLLVLFAILFFGGDTTKPFVLTLIIGISAGTYSSIFVASPLLVLWQKFRERKARA